MSVRILQGGEIGVRSDGRRYVCRRSPRECLHCGGPVPRRGRSAKFCSHGCYAESRKGMSLIWPKRPINLHTLSCVRCGVQVKRKMSAINNGLANFCSRQCSNLYHLVAFSTRSAENPTTIERAVYAALTSSRIVFEKQKNIGKYVVDAYIPAGRIAIEVDGAYWHSLPENIDRDRRKDEALRSYGITVVRVGEAAVRSDAAAALRAAGICL